MIESTTVLSDGIREAPDNIDLLSTYVVEIWCGYVCRVITVKMKSTKVQTSPIYRNRALRHLPQSTEPRAVLGSKYVMATPAQFVKL